MGDKQADEVSKRGGGWFNYFYPEPAAAMAEGRLSAKFTSLDQVTGWVKGFGDDGETFLRICITQEKLDDTSRQIAIAWLDREETLRVNARSEMALQIAIDSADSARRSAKWTMIAAIFAAIGALTSSVVAILEFTMVPSPVEVKVMNPGELRAR